MLSENPTRILALSLVVLTSAAVESSPVAGQAARVANQGYSLEPAGDTMERTEPTVGSKQLLQQWIDAFNRRDVEALVAMYHADAINYQVAAGDPVRGVEAIRADFEALFAGFPDIFAEVENLLEDGDWAAWEWKGGGHFTGEFLGIQPTGRSYELRGCGFFRFRDGLIEFQRGYWDKQTWFSQLGIEEP